MSTDDKKNWAAEYILDPLIEPTPAQETGPGSSFRLTSASTAGVPSRKPAQGSPPPSSLPKQSTGTSASTNPFRHSSPKSPAKLSKANGKSPSTTVHTRSVSGGSTRSFPAYSDEPTRRSAEHARRSPPASASTRPRRTSSLRERFPGDTSHQPLAILTHDNKQANRSPHLRKKHLAGADLVDKLDDTALSSYHHEGPYDAASLARNNSFQNSPVAALDESNKEALKATPREKIQDSLRKHRPLEGVAVVPPGQPDRFGRVYKYKEGANMMIEDGGNYKRWPGLDYLPEDIKGKGEPSYSIEKNLKEHEALAKEHKRSNRSSANGTDIELVERAHEVHDESIVDNEGAATASGTQQAYHDRDDGRRRSGSGAGGRISGEFRRRFGSLRRRDGNITSTSTN